MGTVLRWNNDICDNYVPGDEVCDVGEVGGNDAVGEDVVGDVGDGDWRTNFWRR